MTGANRHPLTTLWAQAMDRVGKGRAAAANLAVEQNRSCCGSDCFDERPSGNKGRARANKTLCHSPPDKFCTGC